MHDDGADVCLRASDVYNGSFMMMINDRPGLLSIMSVISSNIKTKMKFIPIPT